MRSCLAPVVYIHRVRPIKIRPRGDGISIPVPECAGIIDSVQAKGIAVLAKSVEIRVLWERGAEIHILGLKY